MQPPKHGLRNEGEFGPYDKLAFFLLSFWAAQTFKKKFVQKCDENTSSIFVTVLAAIRYLQLNIRGLHEAVLSPPDEDAHCDVQSEFQLELECRFPYTGILSRVYASKSKSPGAMLPSCC